MPPLMGGSGGKIPLFRLDRVALETQKTYIKVDTHKR